MKIARWFYSLEAFRHSTKMNNVLIISFAFAFQSCEDNCTDNTVFVYNEQTGKCENCEGDVGYNIFDIEKIRETKNAECLNLSGKDLVFLLDTAEIENFNESGYNVLDEYNFKGSKFDSSRLIFNNIADADFSGADLRNLSYGYAVITGKTDQYTILPATGTCNTENDSLRCGF